VFEEHPQQAVLGAGKGHHQAVRRDEMTGATSRLQSAKRKAPMSSASRFGGKDWARRRMLLMRASSSRGLKGLAR
jgi:hypothetical protein